MRSDDPTSTGQLAVPNVVRQTLQTTKASCDSPRVEARAGCPILRTIMRLMSNDLEAILWTAQLRRKERAEHLPTTDHCTVALLQVVERLRELGWRDSDCAPRTRSFDAIVFGAAGVHRCTWLGGKTGGWFLEEAHDWWPARIVVWKEIGEVVA